jgi:BlaI family penicillinase repressor
MRELTKAEEQIMLILWDIKEGLAKDVIDKIQPPKPAYNTVSTVLRVLENKGFVDHKAILISTSRWSVKKSTRTSLSIK